MTGERSAAERFAEKMTQDAFLAGVPKFREFLPTVFASSVPRNFPEAIPIYSKYLEAAGVVPLPSALIRGLLDMDCRSEDEGLYVIARTAAIAHLKGLADLSTGTEEYEALRKQVMISLGGMIISADKLSKVGIAGLLLSNVRATRRAVAQQRIKILDEQIETNAAREDLTHFRESLGVIIVE